MRNASNNLWSRLTKLPANDFLQLKDIDHYRVDAAGNVLYRFALVNSPMSWHIDHIFPWSYGGLTVAPNLQVLHYIANNIKRDNFWCERPLSDYRIGISVLQFQYFVRVKNYYGLSLYSLYIGLNKESPATVEGLAYALLQEDVYDAGNDEHSRADDSLRIPAWFPKTPRNRDSIRTKHFIELEDLYHNELKHTDNWNEVMIKLRSVSFWKLKDLTHNLLTKAANMLNNNDDDGDDDGVDDDEYDDDDDGVDGGDGDDVDDVDDVDEKI
jgi:hypothetical protein